MPDAPQDTYRLVKGLGDILSTPPRLHSLCRIWRRERGIVWIDSAHESTPGEMHFNVSEPVFAERFRRVE